MKYEVTLKDLRQKGACYQGYNKVVRGLQGVPYTEDEERSKGGRRVERYLSFRHEDPISLLFILENNGLDDALWAIRCVEGHERDARLYAVWCARRVQQHLGSPRLVAILDVAERFAEKQFDLGESIAVRLTLWTSDDPEEGTSTAQIFEAEHYSALEALECTLEPAEYSAARGAAWASAGAEAWAATKENPGPSPSQAWDAAWEVAWAAEAEMFKLMCQGQAPWQTQA